MGGVRLRRPDAGARSCPVGPDRESREVFAERLAVTRGAGGFAVRPRQVLEAVTAGLAAVFEDRHVLTLTLL